MPNVVTLLPICAKALAKLRGVCIIHNVFRQTSQPIVKLDTNLQTQLNFVFPRKEEEEEGRRTFT